MSMDRPKAGDYYIDRESGKEHLVLGIGQHTETNDIMIYHQDGASYQSLPWVTPLKRWSELIDMPDGRRLFRFEWSRTGNGNQ